MRRLLTSVALGLVLALSHVVPSRAAGGWWYASGDHFEAYTTINEKMARTAIDEFERVHSFFEGFLGLPASHGQRTRIVIFDGPKAFAPYRPNLIAAAFYQSSPEGDEIVLQSLDADSSHIAVHEYAHRMFRRTGAEYPAWLNEGLAEFFSTITPQGDKMRMGDPPLSRVLTLSNAAKQLSLDRLFAIDTASPEYNDAKWGALFYSESWALTHMLLTSDAYRAKSTDLLAAIGGGAQTADAFTAIYGKPITELSRDLDRYVRGERFGFRMVPMPAASQIAPISSRALDATEGGAIAAAVLGHQHGRESEARAAFDTLGRVTPEPLVLLEERGLFEAWSNHPDVARSYLARAIDAGSVSPQAQHTYALLLMSNPAEQMTLLEKALAGAPDDLDIRIDLARALVRAKRGPDAMAALQPVTRVPRDRAFALFEAITLAAVQANLPAEATAAASRATETARTANEVTAAKALAQRAARVSTQTVISGRLTNVLCGSGLPILEITTETGVVRLVVDQPGSIQVGEGGGRAAMDCGPQDRPIRVGYAPVVDASTRTIGAVRMLEFR